MVIANPNPSPSTRFGPGNPSRGRQRAARDKISTAFLEALNEAFYELNGEGGCKGLDAIKKVRDEVPATFAQIYATLPGGAQRSRPAGVRTPRASGSWACQRLQRPGRSAGRRHNPNNNVRSVKEECLSKVILFGERSLRRALSDYVDHFHAERNHQGKGNVLLFPRNTDRHREGPVRCRERLGGLLRCYDREAA